MIVLGIQSRVDWQEVDGTTRATSILKVLFGKADSATELRFSLQLQNVT